ncbi:LamB/YcsF family protein [Pontibacillus litoralis]|uniref:5-oxoprolinase subunit A n=1 Tax=Pontibacillus litoralis JSM 072002 TaxID=1385512 RepID=A0A0A5G490_9BACI|nr:5-oxoprolinase subunit PxpA [Pontibacillus litoralis]KGX86869.1 LamB/YcsF family protein [Pontibacillus litoralis JSM 072002]
MYKLDINCDMGESFGTYTKGRDEEILPYITSANIACGFHAGDASTMKKTVELALEHNVAIGAHPGLNDLVGFGRRNMDITPAEAYDIVVYQIGALQAFVQTQGGTLQHVKPHGALYNMAARNKDLAQAITQAVTDVDSELILFGLAGSALYEAGKQNGLRTASEVFSDRTYQEDGTLTSRRQSNALITDHNQAVQQVIRMVKQQQVHTLQQVDIAIQADTVCIHGDGEQALSFAKHIHGALQSASIKIEHIHTIV